MSSPAHQHRRAGHQRPRAPTTCSASVERRRRRRRGRAGSPGSARPRTRRPPTSRSTPAAARCSPASSTATATWSSPATGPRSSRPGWRGTPYAAGGIRTTVAATRAATDEQLTSHVARLVAEMRRQGTTTVEIKSGYGLTVRDEARSLAVARQFTEETTFLGAHVVPARAADAGGVRRPRHRADARGGARRTPAGSTCSASAAPSTPTRPAPSSPPARPPACAAGCTPTSSAPAPASGWPPSSAWSRSTTAPTSTTRTSTRCATPAPSPRCCPAWSSPPASPTPTPAGCSTPACTVALASDCNPGSCFTSSVPLCIALAVREMGMTPAEAVHAATVRRRRGARPRRRRRAGRPAAAPTWSSSTPPRHVHLAYRPGVPLVARVWLGGRPLNAGLPALPTVLHRWESVTALQPRGAPKAPRRTPAEIRHLPDVGGYLRERISAHHREHRGAEEPTMYDHTIDRDVVKSELDYRLGRIQADIARAAPAAAADPPAAGRGRLGVRLDDASADGAGRRPAEMAPHRTTEHEITGRRGTHQPDPGRTRRRAGGDRFAARRPAVPAADAGAAADAGTPAARRPRCCSPATPASARPGC